MLGIVHPGIYHPMYPGYTPPGIHHCTTLGTPTILPHLGVPVPPYTVCAVRADNLLGSRRE